MRGDKVIVRAYGNKPFIRKVWSVGKGCIYVTNENVFKKLQEGQTELMAIGFPFEDVFVYDQSAMPTIPNEIDWSRMARYLA